MHAKVRAIILSIILAMLLAACGSRETGLDQEAAPSRPDDGIQSAGNQAAQAPEQELEYVALGDSFSSGEGVPPFMLPKNGEQTGCHRSTRAYAELLDQDPELNFKLQAFEACSGAKTWEVVENQLGAITKDTDVVTITIGGNDIGFAWFVRQCLEPKEGSLIYGGESCEEGKTPYATTAGNISRLHNGLGYVFEEIQDEIGPDTKVLVVGYPFVVKERLFAERLGLTCSAIAPPVFPLLTRAEQRAAVDVTLALNAAIANGVTAVGDDRFHYVSAAGDPPFRGHDMCSGQPYFNDYYYFAPEVYTAHPNKKGQEAYARLVKDHWLDISKNQQKDENGRIAYRTGYINPQIYAKDPQGGNEQRITDDGVSPSYSLDGSKVVFTKNGGIYIAEADGSGQTQLTEKRDDEAAFAANGEFIAFIRGTGEDREIYTMKPDGSNQEPLTDGLEGLEFISSPTWNPREVEIAFAASDGDEANIYTVDFPDGDNLQQVTDDRLYSHSLDYSPDGQTIVYAGNDDPNPEDGDTPIGHIYTLASDRSEQGTSTQLTDSPSNTGPVFSPDGERIAYISFDRGQGIFTMDSETGDDKFQVTDNSDPAVYSISWGGQGSSADNGGDPDTGGDIDSSQDREKASLSQAVGDYYLAAGAEEWAYTYDHLASQTQSMFTEEEWSRKNQWFWDRNPVIYHILSTESNGNAEGSIAEVEVRITGEDGSSSARTTYFVQEDGEWKHRFSEAEADLLRPDATFEEFVEAQAGVSSQGTPDADGVCDPPTAEAQDSDCPDDQQVQEAGFERFVGDDWYVHGAQMVIEPNSTGTTTHTLRQCTDSSESHCREVTQLEFSEASSGSVVATVTSVDYETYEGNPPPPGFESYERWQAGDSFELEFVGDSLLRTTWLGQAADLNDEPSNPYWCNSQTTDENSDECGA